MTDVIGATPRRGHNIYTSHNVAPWDANRWPNFSPKELACKGTGRLAYDPEALDMLQALRDRLRRPLIVRSAYRSPEHNRKVGGAKESFHLDGAAFDVSMVNHDPHLFIREARATGFSGVGTYPASNFIHIDNRKWYWAGGAPFPQDARPFDAVEPPREVPPKPAQVVGGVGTAGGAALALREAAPAIDAIGGLSSAAQIAIIAFIALGVGAAVAFGPGRVQRALWRDRGEGL